MLDGDGGVNPGDEDRKTNPDPGDDEDYGERLASAYPESDPEADLSDPESELPDVPSPPSIEIPTPTKSGDEIPGELLAGFWTTVLVFNVAVLATSLGILLVTLGDQERLGAGALAVGLLAAVHGYWKYRALSKQHRNDGWTENSSAGKPPEHEEGTRNDAGESAEVSDVGSGEDPGTSGPDERNG